MAAAPCCAPTNVYSLKFLSLTVPTSVTTPILRSDWVAAEADAEADAPAEPEAAADGAVDAAVDAAGDALAPPLLQAATKMDSPANRASPVLRMRMCPPPGSRTDTSAAVSRPRIPSGRERSPPGATACRQPYD